MCGISVLSLLPCLALVLAHALDAASGTGHAAWLAGSKLLIPAPANPAPQVAKFNGVHSLYLHFPSNAGANTARIRFIGIKVLPAGRGVGPLPLAGRQ